MKYPKEILTENNVTLSKEKEFRFEEWYILWEHGAISLDATKNVTQDTAEEAAAIFVSLFNAGLGAGLAIECARRYCSCPNWIKRCLNAEETLQEQDWFKGEDV